MKIPSWFLMLTQLAISCLICQRIDGLLSWQDLILLDFYQGDVYIFRKDAKGLPRFLLDEERKRQITAQLFLVETWPKNHTTEYSVPSSYTTFVQPANYQLTPLLASTWSKRPN